MACQMCVTSLLFGLAHICCILRSHFAFPLSATPKAYTVLIQTWFVCFKPLVIFIWTPHGHLFYEWKGNKSVVVTPVWRHEGNAVTTHSFTGRAETRPNAHRLFITGPSEAPTVNGVVKQRLRECNKSLLSGIKTLWKNLRWDHLFIPY